MNQKATETTDDGLCPELLFYKPTEFKETVARLYGFESFEDMVKRSIIIFAHTDDALEEKEDRPLYYTIGCLLYTSDAADE